MGTVVITGAASGVGAATRSRLEAEGHRVIGVDRAKTDVIADLSTVEGRRDAIDQVAALCSRLDGVVACAGLGVFGNDPELVVSVNYFGARDFLDGVRPLLAASGDGARAVVVSSSVAAIIPGIPADLLDALLEGDEVLARSLAGTHGNVSAYASSKFAISRWLRRASVTPEWAGAGIRLNGVAPGPTRTPMLEELHQDPQAKAMADLLPIPIGRIGEPEEVAALIDMLLSPVAANLVGQVIYHDGGTEALLRGESWPAVWS
jgi:NAD(P)-dependent dehydrogenase (short-subunit alcohol dehydrogenase family)